MNENNTILFVENDPSLLKLNKAIFESGGYNVLLAADGEEALAVLDENPVNLVITDVLMPRMDGFSLCYAIRKISKLQSVPIIIYSATYISPEDERMAREIGADLFLRKPAPLNLLLLSAENLLSSPRDTSPQSSGADIDKIVRQFNERLVEKLEDKSKKLAIALEEIARNERLFKALVENTFDSISLLDCNGNFLYQSPAMQRLTGYSPQEMDRLSGFDLFHPQDRDSVRKLFDECLSNPLKHFEVTARMLHRDGHYIWIERTLTNQLHDENVKAIVCVFREVTARRQAEEKLMVANRLYAFTSAINKAIVHVSDEQELFRESCRIAIEIGGFNLAFIGSNDPRTSTLELVAQCSAQPEDLENLPSLSYAANGPTAYALEHGLPYVINDFDNEFASPTARAYGLARRFGSAVTMPIKKAGSYCYTFNMLSASKGLFDNQEMSMLEEISADISFALENFEREALRREIAAKLRQSELRLKQAQAIAHIGSWELNFLASTCICSEETCRIYGMSPFDQVHDLEDWFRFIHPEDTEYVQQLIQEGMTSNSGMAFYHRIIRKDGVERLLFARAQFEFNSRNEPISLYGVAHDITESKKSEEALAQSEKNLRMIVDLLPQSVFARNFDGKYLFVNKNFARLYGLEPEQIVGKALKDTIPHKSELDQFIEQDRIVYRTGEPFEIPETTFTDAAGVSRIFRTLKVPYTLAGTTEKAVLGITEDISDQKREEEERAKLMADLVQRNKDLEQFSYIVSHNLRAPVANISGLSEILQMFGLDESDRQKLIQDIGVSVKRLDEVILDLNYILQFKTKAARQKELVRFSDLLADVKFSLEAQIRQDEVTIRSDFSEINEMHTVKGYLFSVFFNLVSNSIKYKKNNTAPLIYIVSKLTSKKIVLTFSDNGLGIDLSRNANFVFGLYKRFHGHVQGKGMGLFMVKTQIESLGGQISVRSEVNKGTEFTIVFDL